MVNNFDSDKEFFDNRSFSNDNQQLLNVSNDVDFKNDYLNTKINQHNLSLIRSCKELSLTYIVLWLILFVFVVSVSISLSNHDKDYDALFIALLTFGLIFGFVLFILGIFLINKTLSLKRCYYSYVPTGLFVWFWVGLYLFGFFSFIGSFLTLNNCNKIENLSFKELETINRNECLNTSVESKQNNLFLLKICSWVSFFYILLWLSLVIFVIVLIDTSGIVETVYMKKMYVGCGCFGFFYFF